MEAVSSRGDLVLKQAQSENYALKLEIDKLRKEVSDLKDKLAGKPVRTKGEEAEVFS